MVTINDELLVSFGFDKRQIDEVMFDMIYAADFAHGTDGHNIRLLVAKLYRTIEALAGDDKKDVPA